MKEETEEEKVYFDELPLNDDVLDGIESMGFIEATPIQAATIPPIIDKKDVIGIAQTGTGKTAAFLIPTMHRLMEEEREGTIGCLIIVPTRELAVQIDKAVEGLAYFTGLSSMAIYGGGDAKSFSQEKRALTQGTDIIIATPGRMISHINLGYVPMDKLSVLVLDEADRMLDMGFYNDIMRIISKASAERQSLLFSATMPDNILMMTRQILNSPVTVNIALSKPADGVEQVGYSVFNNQKEALIENILTSEEWKSVIVFASTKKEVSALNRRLKRKGINCAEISSDLDQTEREQTLLDFRNRKLTVMVATNVVSRGIDIDDIELVINYDVPSDAEDYVHRIGRTARASREGKAVTLISPDEQMKFYRIEQLIGQEVNKAKAPESLGDTPAYDPRPQKKRKRNFKKGGFKGGKKGGNFKGKSKRPQGGKKPGGPSNRNHKSSN